jgi:hypothetical protein
MCCQTANEPWIRLDGGGSTRLVCAFGKADSLSGQPKFPNSGQRGVGLH